MEPARAAHALAEASASLTRSRDVAGGLVAVMSSCCRGLGVDAVGILVETGGELELLAASSHDVAELEVHQLQADEGPCVDAFRLEVTISVGTRAGALRVWPSFGPTMRDAGFGAVHAMPMTWRGRAFGAMGMFRRSETPFSDDEHSVAQAFVDIVTTLVVRLDDVPPEELAQRLARVMAERIVIERAKGVLSDQRQLAMGDAFRALVRDADEAGAPLVQWAQRVVDEAVARPR